MADQTDANLLRPNKVEDPWGDQLEGITKGDGNAPLDAGDS